MSIELNLTAKNIYEKEFKKSRTKGYSEDDVNDYLDLIIEAMGTNMNAAIVSGMNDTMPIVGGKIEELSFMAEGDIAFGYMNNYKLVQRKGVQLATSTDILFFEDQTAFRGTARYDGKPVIAESFAILNIKNVAPTTSVTFPPDKANANKDDNQNG